MMGVEMAKKSKLNPTTLEKEAKVLELRRGGLTFDMIADRLGYASASGAHKAYVTACNRIIYADVIETRKIEMDRLDIAQAAIWTNVIAGEVPSVIALMKIMERRARLLGLDMPTKAQIEVNIYEHDAIDSEVKRLVAILDSQQTSALDAPISESGTITN
jgi:transcriptional regulator